MDPMFRIDPERLSASGSALQSVASRLASELASFRSELELDSLDFLSFVEHLSAATGVRIDEDDYPDLVSMATSVAFLTRSR